MRMGVVGRMGFELSFGGKRGVEGILKLFWKSGSVTFTGGEYGIRLVRV